jgi:DNA-binding NarL/FixJ family response regulator
VLKLIAEGRRNREIAKYLFISVKTVEKHRSNLMHKTNLHNTAALTSLAMEKGLVGNPAAAPPPPPPPALPLPPETAK